MKDVAAVVMAAGLGKRMKSAIPKVLHPVGGRPMIWYSAHLARCVADSTVAIVIGHGGEKVRAYLRQERVRLAPFTVVEQAQQYGTGHAVQQAKNALFRHKKPVADQCVILNGDTPLLTEKTIRALLKLHSRDKAIITLLTVILDDPQGYGRVVRGEKDRVLRVVEDSDASKTERAIKEVNVGTYVIETDFLFKALEALQPQNTQGEYYLTDIIEGAVTQGLRVSALAATDPLETLGINTREHLALAEKHLRHRICSYWMQAGVTMLDPNRITIDAEVEIGRDTVLHPDVTLEGHTRIGEGSIVRSHTRITDSIVGDRVCIQDSCVLNNVCVEDEVSIGPFAHLRPGTRLRHLSKVGNFVELKMAELGEGSKANHLAYLGDAVIGRDVNVGAGTITCNYDGYRKARTVIEDQVFVGSDSQLIAPVRIGRGAVIAAGTTVTQNVPPDALGISRSIQINKEGAAARRRALYSTNLASTSRKKVRGKAKQKGKP